MAFFYVYRFEAKGSFLLFAKALTITQGVGVLAALFWLLLSVALKWRASQLRR